MVRIVIVVLAAVTLYGGFNEVKLAWFVDWPPRFGKPFPDVTLVDHRGEMLRIGDFAGKVVLVHPVAMSSPASNAFAGGGTLGGVGGVRPQAGLQSLEFYLARYGNARLDDSGLALVHLLLYDLEADAPDREDAALWADRFRLDERPNVHVVTPRTDLRGRASAGVIPGVFLVDKRGFVRYAAAGRPQRHDLFRELLPAAPSLLAR